MIDRAHVDELLSGMNAFLFTISFFTTFCTISLSPPLSLFLSHFISIRTSSFFYRYIRIYVCHNAIVKSEFHAREEIFFPEILLDFCKTQD